MKWGEKVGDWAKQLAGCWLQDDKRSQLEIIPPLPVFKHPVKVGDRYLVRTAIKMRIMIGSPGFSRARSGELFFLS